MLNISKDCLHNISKKEFFIIDDENQKPSKIVDSNGQFKVINNIDNNLTFLQIDDCVYKSKDDSRCDCAIYSHSIFSFIELKTCKKKNSKPNRRKAEKQLEETIVKFKNHYLLEGKKLEAYVCLTCHSDGKLIHISSTANQDKILEFEEDYNTKLEYICNKKFEV